MSGCILFEQSDQVGWVSISHVSRFNAMSRGMWRELRCVFERADRNSDMRCIVVAGEGANFCAGGDISEYTEFRFQEATLREFHEVDVWGGLQAMLARDLPIGAHIEGIATEPTPGLQGTSYGYADSAEHREGILAFLEKRKPIF